MEFKDFRVNLKKRIFVAGTRTRVSRVRAEYPNQLDYNGLCLNRKLYVFIPILCKIVFCHDPHERIGLRLHNRRICVAPPAGTWGSLACTERKQRTPTLQQRQQGMAPGFLAKQNHVFIPGCTEALSTRTTTHLEHKSPATRARFRRGGARFLIFRPPSQSEQHADRRRWRSLHGLRAPLPQPHHVRHRGHHRRLGHQLQHRRELQLTEGRIAAGAPVPDLLPDRQPGDGVLRHLRAPRGRHWRLHVHHRPARRHRGVPSQHDVRRRVRHRHLDPHPPRHGVGVQGDQRQLEAREPAHPGGVHHHPDRYAAALRRVAPRRRARGHPGDAHRRQGLITERTGTKPLASTS